MRLRLPAALADPRDATAWIDSSPVYTVGLVDSVETTLFTDGEDVGTEELESTRWYAKVDVVAPNLSADGGVFNNKALSDAATVDASVGACVGDKVGAELDLGMTLTIVKFAQFSGTTVFNVSSRSSEKIVVRAFEMVIPLAFYKQC